MIENNHSLSLQRGFSLVELAVVLLIISLLVGGSISLLSAQREAALYKDSASRLLQIKKALLSHVSANGYLPCPDTDSPDTQHYGLENRTNHVCDSASGTVPFLNLGLSANDAEDGFLHLIHYFVNQNVTDAVQISDRDNSASYFASQNAPIFYMQTPPVATSAGTGNYDVCDREVLTNCAASAKLEYANVSVVLLADNQAGSGGCNAQSSSEIENCDGDTLFWQGNFTVPANQTRVFDDKLMAISGYELKTELLRNNPTALANSINSNNNNNNAQNNALIAPPPPPTNPANTIAGNYTGPSDYNPPGGSFNDSLKVDGDLNAVLDLNNGNNELTVTGNQNSAIISGSGNDNFYIEGDAKSSITTGSGNDNLTILGSLTSVASVDMGSGTDFVYVIGDVNGLVDLGSGDDTFRVDGDLAHAIDGDAGTDVIYVNKTPDQWAASSQATYLNGFERIRFNDGTAQDL